MVRVTNKVAYHRKRKRLYKKAKGFVGDRKNHMRLTKDAVMKSMAYNYIHRKKRKSNFRRLWIIRLNVAAKIHGISYSKLMEGLKKFKSSLNRKMLSELAISDPQTFAEIVNRAKKALAA